MLITDTLRVPQKRVQELGILIAQRRLHQVQLGSTAADLVPKATARCHAIKIITDLGVGIMQHAIVVVLVQAVVLVQTVALAIWDILPMAHGAALPHQQP